jgi:DNA polymerase-3 subunit gamma/tau
LGVQRREREAREIERIRDHPEVKQVLQRFPDARIAAVRPTATEEAPADIDEGAEAEFKEDGTHP